MARTKSRLVVKVVAGGKKKSKSDKTKNDKNQQDLLLVELVDIVRKSRKREKADDAFGQIIRILKYKIDQLVYKFNIPGYSKQDIRQEALYALRYKAIKDYDQHRSIVRKISPFDKFAMLCMRRHLSTRLKSSYQNKSITLNRAASLDTDRGFSNKDEENLFLSDIVIHTEGNVMNDIAKQEDFNILMSTLYKRLSALEKEVLKLYSCKYSYVEIANIINKQCKSSKKDRVEVKSIDNALSRIKNKAKAIIYKMENNNM